MRITTTGRIRPEHSAHSAASQARPGDRPSRRHECRSCDSSRPSACDRMDLPHASRDPTRRAGRLSDLRHGARAARSVRRGGRESRAQRHDSTILDRRRADDTASVVDARRAVPGDQSDAPLPAFGRVVGPARARDARRAVGRLAVFRPRLAVRRQPQPQHVHVDRARHRLLLGFSPSSRPCCPGSSRIVPRRVRCAAAIFRGRGRDRHARSSWAGPRAPGAGADVGRDPSAPAPGAEGCAPRRRTRQGT